MGSEVLAKSEQVATSASTAIPDREELIERAQAMVPVLVERAPECERLRRAPFETIADFRKAGFFKICQPRKYGGYELGYDVLCEVIMEVAHGCGSSAWNLAVLGEHNVTMANSSAQFLEELWGENHDTLIASGNDPQAELERVDGGLLFNGTLKFSSACDHVDWWLTGAREKTTGERYGVAIPKSDVQIVEDSWHVIGLAGSGSKDVEIKGAFIPEHRIRPVPGSPAWAGANAHVSNPANYRLSQQSTKPFTLSSVSVGIAGGYIQGFVQQMMERRSRFGDKVNEFQSLHLRLAESAAEYDCARRTIVSDLRESLEILKHEEDLPAEMHRRNQRDLAYAPKLAQAAVDRLFYAGGARNLSTANNFQRQFRDVHASGAQFFLNWDVNATIYGRARLGLDPGALPGP